MRKEIDVTSSGHSFETSNNDMSYKERADELEALLMSCKALLYYGLYDEEFDLESCCKSCMSLIKAYKV